MKERLTFLFFLSVQVMAWIGFSACAPEKKYYMKEVIKEYLAEPPAGAYADHFIYEEPSGNVDILFVIDNTDIMKGAFNSTPLAPADLFQPSYENFLQKWDDPELKNVGYQVQIITTPSDRFFKHLATSKNDRKTHVAANFTNPEAKPPEFPFPYILTFDETEHPRPFRSALTGISTFKRDFSTLFLVFALGKDHSSSHSEENHTAFEQQLQTKRGLYQTHTWLLANQNNGKKKGGCPLEYPSNFIREASELKIATTLKVTSGPSDRYIDLCDPNWDAHWGDDLFKAIVAEKRKYVLSRQPYKPEASLTVKTMRQLLRRELDYTFDALTNEIIILPAAGLTKGEQIFATYYLAPPKEVFPGGKAPGGEP
jgi:hypothetical protein